MHNGTKTALEFIDEKRCSKAIVLIHVCKLGTLTARTRVNLSEAAHSLAMDEASLSISETR